MFVIERTRGLYLFAIHRIHLQWISFKQRIHIGSAILYNWS